MIRFRAVVKSIVAFCMSGAVLMVITVAGCKTEDDREEEVVYELAVTALTDFAESKFPGCQRRSRAALSKLKNDVLDAEPILIRALIGLGGPNANEPVFGLTCFDEDKDIRGFRIKEHYVDPNGAATTLEEDYPVFVGSLTRFIVENLVYPIQIRGKHQRKDKYLWLEYVNWNLEGLIHEYVDKRPRDHKDASVQGVPEKQMPPIYISIPDPNRVQVLVSVYDRAGHESESVKLFKSPTFDLLNQARVRQLPAGAENSRRSK